MQSADCWHPRDTNFGFVHRYCAITKQCRRPAYDAARPPPHFMFPCIPAELLFSYPVTPKMNRASFNDPAAIAPLEPAIT